MQEFVIIMYRNKYSYSVPTHHTMWKDNKPGVIKVLAPVRQSARSSLIVGGNVHLRSFLAL